MNIVEFSTRVGVSTATVSRAFHEPEKLRAHTRERILQLAQELGFYPSPSGRALKRGKSDMLGLIWPLEVEGAEAEYAQRILAALTHHLVARDLDMLVCPIDRNQPATLAHAHRTLQRSRCDGWILLYPRRHDALVNSLAASRKPVVCFMGALPEQPAWKSVRLAQEPWVRDALSRLKSAGCRGVVFFGARPEEPDHEDRRAAFWSQVEAFFGKATSELPGYPPDAAALGKLLLGGKTDAVIGVDDRAALVALGVCRKHKIRVPEQVKVVGIDDIAQAEQNQPSLSTYRLPLDRMAGCAVELATGERGRSRIFEAKFVARETLK